MYVLDHTPESFVISKIKDDKQFIHCKDKAQILHIIDFQVNCAGLRCIYTCYRNRRGIHRVDTHTHTHTQYVRQDPCYTGVGKTSCFRKLSDEIGVYACRYIP